MEQSSTEKGRRHHGNFAARSTSSDARIPSPSPQALGRVFCARSLRIHNGLDFRSWLRLHFGSQPTSGGGGRTKAVPSLPTPTNIRFQTRPRTRDVMNIQMRNGNCSSLAEPCASVYHNAVDRDRGSTYPHARMGQLSNRIAFNRLGDTDVSLMYICPSCSSGVRIQEREMYQPVYCPWCGKVSHPANASDVPSVVGGRRNRT